MIKNRLDVIKNICERNKFKNEIRRKTVRLNNLIIKCQKELDKTNEIVL
jgi:hypothetical protein